MHPCTKNGPGAAQSAAFTAIMASIDAQGCLRLGRKRQVARAAATVLSGKQFDGAYPYSDSLSRGRSATDDNVLGPESRRKVGMAADGKVDHGR